jgi:hypothetical protein
MSQPKGGSALVDGALQAIIRRLLRWPVIAVLPHLCFLVVNGFVHGGVPAGICRAAPWDYKSVAARGGYDAGGLNQATVSWLSVLIS